jgi:hypothetical protein
MSLAHRSTITQPTCDKAAGRWKARLVVDDSDTVIFDHHLDHVPAMLALHGIAELIEQAGPEPSGDCAAGSFDLSFTRFAEKDRPAYVTVVPAAGSSAWRVELTQSEHVVCAGTASTVALAGEGKAGPPRSPWPPPQGLAEATLVHRQRPENIVVTALRTGTDGYTVTYVPPEAGRTKRFESFHHPLDVVEASRQFVTLLSHAVCGFDLDTYLVLSRLVVRTPQVFRRTGTISLFSDEPRVDRRRVVLTVHARCEDAPPTSISWDIHAVAPAVYARLRRASHG